MTRYQHLVGRVFLPGVSDCYEIVRDYFRDNFGIELSNYARPSDWRAGNANLIHRLHDREGFVMHTDLKPKELRPADVLACAVGESSPNHLVVYVGDNTVIHHLHGRLSAAEPYREFFRYATSFVLRHRDVPDLRPVLPTTDIRSLLRERYNLPTAD